jgi:short-chain 2-methylacyl-CoA dehydrogenase
LFLAQYQTWIKEMKALALKHPGIGAAALAAGMELWFAALQYLTTSKDSKGKSLYSNQRQGVSFNMADALCWLLASRYQILDTLELEEKGPANPVLAENIQGFVNFFSDLCELQAARAASEATRICSQLVYGYLAAGSQAPKELEGLSQIRSKVEASLAGSFLAKDRAAEAVTHIMIPEALDYPL